MAYEIFWGAGSPNSWRPLLGLEVMGLKYESKVLEFSKQEHRTPEMLKMNPRGLLPVLRDGDTVVYESVAILAYLDKKQAGTPIFGSTAIETGQIWQCVFEIENYLRPALEGIIQPVFFDVVAERLDSIAESADIINTEFKVLEQRLTQQNYLVGDAISAADIILFPFIQGLLRAMTLEAAKNLDLNFKQFNSHYPEIAQWIARIEMIPGYSNTYPPNWIE